MSGNDVNENKNADPSGGILNKEDYAEPSCVLCGKPFGQEEIKPVPVGRIFEKMDEYMGRQDLKGAERLLAYWLNEAELGRDLKGQFALHNELMGYYRKVREKENAFRHAEAALALIGPLEIEDSPSAGTCYVNSGTVFAAFDEPDRSLPYFEKARDIYESRLSHDDSRLGALYNNMGLTYLALGRYADAHAIYGKALSVMSEVPNGSLEMAITYLNDADVYEAEETENSEEIIQDLLSKAKACFEDPVLPRDGYYAFVCEKCAPIFTYFGWSDYGNDLEERAERLYAANRVN